MKKLLMIVVLFISINCYAPNNTYYNEMLKNKINNISLINNNITILKTVDFKWYHRKDVFKLIRPVIFNRIKEQAEYFNMNPYELTDCISILFISESSDSKGNPAKNNLFRLYNNGFGIKGNNVYFNTWEEIKGEKINIKVTFKSFNSVNESIDYIIYMLLTDRYIDVRNSNNYKDFFKNLYKCGYMTDTKWSVFATKMFDKMI